MLSTVLEDNHENKDDNQSAFFPRLFLMTIYLYEKEAKYMPFVSKKSKKNVARKYARFTENCFCSDHERPGGWKKTRWGSFTQKTSNKFLICIFLVFLLFYFFQCIRLNTSEKIENKLMLSRYLNSLRIRTGSKPRHFGGYANFSSSPLM